MLESLHLQQVLPGGGLTNKINRPTQLRMGKGLAFVLSEKEVASSPSAA